MTCFSLPAWGRCNWGGGGPRAPLTLQGHLPTHIEKYSSLFYFYLTFLFCCIVLAIWIWWFGNKSGWFSTKVKWKVSPSDQDVAQSATSMLILCWGGFRDFRFETELRIGVKLWLVVEFNWKLDLLGDLMSVIIISTVVDFNYYVHWILIE